MSEKILEWFAKGEAGLSSKALALAAICEGDGPVDYPYDPADINRCFELIHVAPEAKDGLARLAARSAQWASLESHWIELQYLFESEVGRNWSAGKRAEKTYNRMKDLFSKVERL